MHREVGRAKDLSAPRYLRALKWEALVTPSPHKFSHLKNKWIQENEKCGALCPQTAKCTGNRLTHSAIRNGEVIRS